MSGSSHSSRMLPLLLLSLLLCLFASSSASNRQRMERHCRLHEFPININRVQNAVKGHNCPQNCSMDHITKSACRCLNLSMSEGERVFPNYFTKGLTSLNLTSHKRFIESLNRTLNLWSNTSETVSMKVEPVITPVRFCEKLQETAKQMQSMCADPSPKTKL